MSKAAEGSEIRRKQDTELKLAMAIDQSKAEAKRRAERKRKAAEREAAEAVAAVARAVEERKAAVARSKEERAARRAAIEAALPEQAAKGSAGAVEVRLSVPGGKFDRVFPDQATVRDLLDWVSVLDARCFDCGVFQVTLPPARRLRSDMDADDAKRLLADIDLHKACVRVNIIDDGDIDESD